MRWMMMGLAGVLAATSLAPAAEAQRWRDDDRGWPADHGDRDGQQAGKPQPWSR